MNQPDNATITFRCLPELEGILPRPIPALLGLPTWFKAMPQNAFSETADKEVMTIKKCPPVVDAMTYGFFIPLVADLRVENGEFFWDHEVPATQVTKFSCSPIDFHDSAQAAGSPFFEDDRFIVKFNNFWTMETPPGYSLLFTHPMNRIDLPFTTISGLVDTDVFPDNLINFPARWHDENFSGVLPKGTPVAQCIPIKRESWGTRAGPMSAKQAQKLSDTTAAIAEKPGVYRRRFRASKQ